MKPLDKAFNGIFIRVEDISTDLMKYIGLSADHLKYKSDNYINVYKYSDKDTWECLTVSTEEMILIGTGRLVAKTSQEVFDFMFDCDLEN